MKNKLLKIFDKTFLKFIVVGIINTLFGTAIMFFCFNILQMDYWVSSAMNYLCGGILSYFLNKKYTFEVKETSSKAIIRFAINLTVCYLLAYGVAKTYSLVSFPRSRRKITRKYRTRDWNGLVRTIKLRGTTFLGVQTR